MKFLKDIVERSARPANSLRLKSSGLVGIFVGAAWVAPPEPLGRAEWLHAVISVVSVVEENSCWWLGDLYNAGPPDALAKLRELTESDGWKGPDWGTFQTYGSVAKRFIL